jgi:hypothetical protein
VRPPLSLLLNILRLSSAASTNLRTIWPCRQRSFPRSHQAFLLILRTRYCSPRVAALLFLLDPDNSLTLCPGSRRSFFWIATFANLSYCSPSFLMLTATRRNSETGLLTTAFISLQRVGELKYLFAVYYIMRILRIHREASRIHFWPAQGHQ